MNFRGPPCRGLILGADFVGPSSLGLTSPESDNACETI